jgi:hypothetical protein
MPPIPPHRCSVKIRKLLGCQQLLYRTLPEEDPADDGPPPLVDQPAAGGGAGGSAGGGGGDSEGSSFEEDPANLDWLVMLSRGEDPSWPFARFVLENAEQILQTTEDSIPDSTTDEDFDELMKAAVGRCTLNFTDTSSPRLIG